MSNELSVEGTDLIRDEIEQEIGQISMEALVEFLNNYHYELKDWRDYLDDFNESYQGWYDSTEEFAERLADEIGILGDMSENLKYYFDYEKFGRDLLSGDYWESNGYYFRSM